ncbi:MAG: glycosyltransferase family 2 protein [Planctomycetes bacterium]|nr:glycosyltransferase family 2 protein [Planctomycetota bacterium]
MPTERATDQQVIHEGIDAAAGDSPPSRSIEKTRGETYVVIPAYHEAKCIAQVAREVRAEFPNVVVVDDGSGDETYREATRAATFTLRHVVNRGQGAALQTGIAFALQHGARYVVTFDADGQHDPDDIAALLAPITAGECDVTLGSRFLGQKTLTMPFSRQLLLRLAVIFTRVVSGMRLTDTHNGLRAFSRRAAEAMDITLDGMAHASELLDQIKRAGLAYREVPVRIRYSDYSLAKGQTLGGAFRILVHYLFGRLSK